jgi:hypothetical protein
LLKNSLAAAGEDGAPAGNPARLRAARVGDQRLGVDDRATAAQPRLELKRHYTDTQIVDIVAVIASFGFFNRFNDTMATELEASPIEAGQRFLAQNSWTVGKHAG